MSYRHGNTYAAHQQYQAAAANYDNASPEDYAPYDDGTHRAAQAIEDAIREDRDAMQECVVEAAGFSATETCESALLALRDASPALRKLRSGETLNVIDREALNGLAARAGEVYDAVETEVSKEVARRMGRDAA